MAAARETKETVSSGREIKSVDRTDSEAVSRDATEAIGNSTTPDGEAGTPAAVKANGGGSIPLVPPAEPSAAGPEGEPSLGKTLAATRERRNASRADVVAETRIPAHYIEMIENSDYGLISDQLYLMPFVRRYATFLDLDGEEVAMRFVREVQRAERAAVAAPRLSEPLPLHDRKRLPWGRVVMVILVLSAIVILYFIASEHHGGEVSMPQSSSQSAPVAPNAALPPAAAPVSMAAPVPMVAPAPPAAAPARLPQSTVVRGPKAPLAMRPPQRALPARVTSPSNSNDE
jgi:hypothetical protein